MAKTILISSDSWGAADPELGRTLMKKFVFALAKNEQRPSAILLVNRGVTLACEGSPVLQDLGFLADAGVAIAACGTCLKNYGLVDSLRVGEVGTMPDAVETMLGDSDVLSIG